MTSVGSILRKERESQRRAISEIAAELCITQRYLQAIEDDETAGVPGLFFYKNFARQYAGSLGLDEGLIRPALDAIHAPEDAPPSPAICVPNRLVQETNRRHIPDISMGWSVIGLVVVLLGCSGIYAWWKRVPQAPAAVALAQRTMPVAMVSSPLPSMLPEAQTAVQTGEANSVVLKLSATERTWLSISSDGKEIFAGILQPSESKTLTGLDRATMKVGNAGGIEVLWNGKIISPLGTRGQVLTIKITPEDFEIVPPPPKQEL
ncbi:MAG TPA: RodZ domain-containing protein [Bryobacteraceae bacterium]|jgi:cytoskeleton protein RodZ|nr:RodZ domain-containing protein [Bryobacteraceae bacterium]